jgi:ArsR family transcriptional regulator, lead/cadmium/zinc/bismuth-responsive transcriptional repressor
MDLDHPVHVRSDDDTPADELVEELRSLLAEAEGFETLAQRMALLSDPRRLQILFCIHAHPGVRSSDIARAIGAHESTTSHALALLRDAGWVRPRREGRQVRYELADGFAHELLHRLGSGHLSGVRHHSHVPPES